MLKLFILFFTFTTLLFSANPRVYESLGNPIYNNIENIKKLTTIGDFYLYVDGINHYIVNVELAKQLGFSLGKDSAPEMRNKYLQTLRKLSKENNYYKRLVQRTLEAAIQNGDSLLFSKLINSGLIDTKANKKKILTYYFKHKKDINPSGIIQSFLDRDATLLKRRNEAIRRRKLLKKKREKEKIERLRKEDEARQRALENRLDREVEKQKREIREEQREELLKSLKE
ncbi:hypothetical protein MNB_SM-5-372 [hydrothermal vent metagenome]|uniref:Uncharacterized protein n=1 Tax=hydrothermal vent metagenome TaxID=652676 RepID=A0A1W1CEA7_9ZZZZ